MARKRFLVSVERPTISSSGETEKKSKGMVVGREVATMMVAATLLLVVVIYFADIQASGCLLDRTASEWSPI